MRIRALISSVSLWVLILALAGGAMAQTLTVFDAPNASSTEPWSINAAGEITGFFFDTNTSTRRGFVRDKKGIITVFAPPPNSSDTRPRSINAPGKITGRFDDTNTSTVRGFVRSP